MDVSLGHRRHIKKLQNVHMPALRTVLGLRWQDHVTGLEVLERAQSTSIESNLIKAYTKNKRNDKGESRLIHVCERCSCVLPGWKQQAHSTGSSLKAGCTGSEKHTHTHTHTHSHAHAKTHAHTHTHARTHTRTHTHTHTHTHARTHWYTHTHTHTHSTCF